MRRRWARGVRFGRGRKPKPENYVDVRGEWALGRISSRAAAQKCGCSHKTFLKWMKEEIEGADF